MYVGNKQKGVYASAAKQVLSLLLLYTTNEGARPA